MNIAYDIFIDYPEAVEIVSSNPALDMLFGELLNFVEGRLEPLTKDIEREEVSDQNTPRATIICVLRNDDKVIAFIGYSQQLQDRMLSCFSKDDMDLVLKNVEAIKYARGN